MKLRFIRTTGELNLTDRQKWPDSELQTKFNEINNIAQILSISMFKLFGAVLLAVLSLSYLANISIVGLVFIIVFMPLSYIANVKSIDIVSSNFKDVMETNVKVMNSFMNFTNNINLFKLNFMIVSKESEFQNEIYNITQKQIKSSKSQILASSIIANFYTLITVVFILVCGHSVIEGKLQVGDYIAAIQYVGLVYVPITLFASAKLSISPALVSYKRTIEYINQERSNLENGSIDLDNVVSIKIVNPKYRDYVSLNLNKQLSIGDMYHLTGVNGSGKSTIVKMLLKLFPIESGDILINDISIAEISKKSIWENIHYVNQSTEIFNGTVL